MIPTGPLHFRLLAWNVAGAFRRKTAAVEDLRPDVAVLSEVRLPDVADWATARGHAFAWAGEEGKSGLAVVGAAGWSVERGEGTSDRRLFLPAVVRSGRVSVALLGACVKPGTRGYAATFAGAVGDFAGILARRPAIIAGDFNLSVGFDRRTSPSRRFGPIVERLAAMGFSGAWHGHTGEAHGEETAATYHHRRRGDPSARFHIDHVFHTADLAVSTVAIGRFEDYVATGLSDHLPVVVDFAIRPHAAATGAPNSRPTVD
jgi:exonuclease III